MVTKATKAALKASADADDTTDFDFPDSEDGIVHDEVDVEVDVEGETEPKPKKKAAQVDEEEEEEAPAAKKDDEEEEEEEDESPATKEAEADIEKELLRARLERAEGAINALTESLGKKAATDNKAKIERALLIAKEDLKAAIENDDAAKQADLLMAVQELTVMKRDAETQETAAPVRQAAPEIPAEAKKWLSKNPWFSKQAHAEKREFAKSQHALIEAMGYDSNSPMYFKELDKRMKRNYPEMYTEKPRKQSSVTVAHVNQAPKTPAGKVTWDKKDAATMREYKLDPNNKEHRREWAMTKAKLSNGAREFTFT